MALCYLLDQCCVQPFSERLSFTVGEKKYRVTARHGAESKRPWSTPRKCPKREVPINVSPSGIMGPHRRGAEKVYESAELEGQENSTL